MMEKIEEARFFDQLADKTGGNRGANLNLDGHGIIHVERELPFMLVYRPVHAGEQDGVIENLLRNEASYMICPEPDFPEYRRLLKKVVKKMSDIFGAFLLLEIWSDPQKKAPLYNSAVFELYGPSDLLQSTVKPIANYLKNMDLAGLVPVVQTKISENRCQETHQPLLDRKKLKQLECLLLGLEVEQFYNDPKTGLAYPLLERKLYSEFSKVLKKSVFDFVKVQTSHKISGFQSLAKRTLQSDVWQIDEQLVDIDNQIHFLMLVSPVNSKKAWKEFKKNNFKKKPVFHYRMMPEDPELLKRKLYNIRIEEIDDPTLGFLFREKRAEIDKMLTMLNERESPGFFYGSLQVFGAVSHNLLTVAQEILEKFPADETEQNNTCGYYNTDEFAEVARQELQFLKQQYHEVKTEVEIKDSIDNMMVNKGIFNIPSGSRIRKTRANALIQHEIGTHVLTYYNGKSQPLKLLSSGVPGYEELQEGIAVLAEHLSGGLSVSRMQILAARVFAVDSLVNRNEFTQTFELLTDGYHFNPETAFYITTRVHRGGGLTKDAIYLRGLLHLIRYLKEDNPLEPLLIGKIKQEYLPVINELISRQVLKPLRIKPRYLSDAESVKKLKEIKFNTKITDLINPAI